jgi:hypothetical protein
MKEIIVFDLFLEKDISLINKKRREKRDQTEYIPSLCHRSFVWLLCNQRTIIICNISRKHLVWRVPVFFFPKRNKSCWVLSTQASKLIWPGSGYFIYTLFRNPCHCWLSHLLLGLPVSLAQQRHGESPLANCYIKNTEIQRSS